MSSISTGRPHSQPSPLSRPPGTGRQGLSATARRLGSESPPARSVQAARSRPPASVATLASLAEPAYQSNTFLSLGAVEAPAKRGFGMGLALLPSESQVLMRSRSTVTRSTPRMHMVVALCGPEGTRDGRPARGLRHRVRGSAGGEGCLRVASKERVAQVPGAGSAGGAAPAAVPDAAALRRGRQLRRCAPSAAAPGCDSAPSGSLGWLRPLRRQHPPNQSGRCQERTKRRALLPPPSACAPPGPPPLRASAVVPWPVSDRRGWGRGPGAGAWGAGRGWGGRILAGCSPIRS